MKSYFFLIILSISLIGLVSSAETFGYGRTENIPINYSNIVINETSNQSEYWNTNLGSLDNANSTHFENIGGALTINSSWIDSVNFWQRVGTILSPKTTGDSFATIGNLTIGNPTTPGAAGQSIFASQTYPVVDIIRDTLTGTGNVFSAVKLERLMTGGTAVDGSGIGIYFKTPDDAGNSTYAGMFGGMLTDVSDGNEVGAIKFASSWQGADPYPQNHLEIRATSATTGNVLIKNGHLKIGLLATGIDAQLVILDTTSKLFNAKFFTDHSDLNDTTGLGFGVHTGATKYMKSAIVHQRKDSWGKGDMVFLVDAAATATDVAITDEVMRLTSAGALTLTGGGDFNSAGKGIFGSTYEAVIGDDGNSRAGYFYDGTRSAEIADGSHAGYFSDGTRYAYLADGSQAGYFYDGTRSVDIADGTHILEGNIGSGGNYGIYLYDSSSNYITLMDGNNNIANFYKSGYGNVLLHDSSGNSLYSSKDASGSTAGYFYDGSRYAQFADGSYAGYFSGDVYITGTLTTSGGSDPPYLLWFNETRDSVSELTKRNIPSGREQGIIQFYNQDTNTIEFMKPATCEFFKLDKGSLVLLEDRDGVCYNDNTITEYYFNPNTGEAEPMEVIKRESEFELLKDVVLDKKSGNFYNATTKEIISKENAVKRKEKGEQQILQ